MEPRKSADHGKDNKIASPLTATPYLLFYSDVLKELSSTKDPVDIAKEARARWSKMTPRSLQPYVEAASLMKSSLKIEPLTKKIEKIENKIEPFGKLKKTKSSRDLMKLGKQPEIFKLRKQPKQKSWDDILSERKKKCQIVAPKRVTYNFDKIPSNRNKTTRGVSKSRALKYKKQNVKTKCCKKKYCCAKKKPKKKKASKCKKPCPCKKLKGDCHCHNKKNLTENVINRQLQDYLRYKSKRKRKLKQGIEDFDINF